MNDKLGTKFVGHVKIVDANTKEVLVDKFNSIHFENMSEALALALANRPTGNIHEMVFGNGGSVVSGIGTVTYFPPNVTGKTAQIYNQTYRKVVNDLSPLNTDPTNNYMRVKHAQNTIYSDVVIVCTLNATEPADQMATDLSSTTEGTYVFDEIGLKAYETIAGAGKLLTHCIFHPVQKSLNRTLEITYTIRIYMS
jgi:hypothetical protein